MTLRRLTAGDVDEAARHARLAFGESDVEGARDVSARRIADGELWGLESGGALLGTCRLLLSDHWFGGRRVPCLDVAAVAVPPEHRGRGVARALMTAALEHGVTEGAGLSTLFPASTTVYRRLGWDLAGAFVGYRIDARMAPAEGPALRLAGAVDRRAIRACAERAAARRNGIAARREALWQDLEGAAFAYVLDGEDGAVDAYVLLDHREDPGDWRHTLAVRDWAATTHDGLAAVLGFVGRHGTFAKDATLRDGEASLLTGLALEQRDVARTSGFAWMARGVHVAAALRARGYPAGFAASVTLAVDDPLLPSARGPWRLTITDRCAEVEPSDPDAGAQVRLDARAFGPLFTSYRTPDELQLLGLCDGDPDALALLTTAFSGPTPLQLDFF